MATDPSFFMSTFVEVPDMNGTGNVKLILNSGQRKYLDEIWTAGVRKDVVGKSRKWGFSTLRLALGLHDVLFSEGRVFRVVAHRLETAKFLNYLVKVMYESAVKNIGSLGEDPHWFIPHPTTDKVTGYVFKETGSTLQIDTAGGKGVGQADRNDDLYLTEFSDWGLSAEIVLSGLIGSQPVGSPFNRVTIDFNAHGIGSYAYTVWMDAQKDQSDADWNGFVPFFVGVRDVPEIYSEEFLEEKKRILRKRFPEVYPSTAEEMWLSNERAVFDREDIEAACSRTGDSFCGSATRYVHGVDTATGREDGDWQVCVTLGFRDGMWWQVAPALRMRVPEDVFAEEVHRRAQMFPGIVVVERNVGSAVLVKLREFGTTTLYRHKDRDRDGKQRRQLGFPTTYSTKKVMISTLQEMLRDGAVGLVSSEPVVQQLREFEWKSSADGSDGLGLAGAPDRQGAHDDDAMALMLALQGVNSIIDVSSVQMAGV